jgi:hypothetical protein
MALDWWLHSRKLLPKPIRRGFDFLFFLVGWSLWKERNAGTFNRNATSAMQLVTDILEELEGWCLADYRHLRSLSMVP